MHPRDFFINEALEVWKISGFSYTKAIIFKLF